MRNFVAFTLLLFSASEIFGQPSFDKGKALYESAKFTEAEEILETVSEKSTGYPAAQYYLGRIAFDKKEYDDAADYFYEATESNPRSGEYFNWLGDAYAAIATNANMMKKMSIGPKAMKAWERATQLDAKNINARVSLVSAYLQAPAFMGGGADKSNAMATEAFVLLDEALKKTPDNYLYLYAYGKSSALTGLKLDNGEECMKKYLNHTPAGGEPSIAASFMRLGQIQEKKNNKADAKKNYTAALKLDDKLKGAKEGLERTSK